MRAYLISLLVGCVATSVAAKCFDSVEVQPQPVKAEDVAPKSPPAPVPGDPAGPKYDMSGPKDSAGPKYGMTSVSSKKSSSPKTAKTASKGMKAVHSGCPKEIEGAQISDIFKGFSYKEYLDAAKPGNDPVMGSYSKIYSQYKGKNGVYYDVYAIAHDEDDMDMSKIVNTDTLKAGKLQLLDKVNGCVYYSEIPPGETEGENEDEHEEVILLFVRSEGQRPLIPKGSVTAGVTEEALKTLSSSKDNSKKEDSAKDDDGDTSADDEEGDDDSDKKDSADKKDKDKDSAPIDAKDDNDDEEDFDFSGGSSSGDDSEDDADA